MMRAGMQAACMQGRFLRRQREWREECGINCRKREMGGYPAHGKCTQMLAGLRAQFATSAAWVFKMAGRGCALLTQIV
jgi:hypothetical protein